MGIVLLGLFLRAEIRDRHWRQIPEDLVWDSVTNSVPACLRKNTGALNEWLGQPKNSRSDAGQFYLGLLDLHSDSQIRRDQGMKSLTELGFKGHEPAQLAFSEAARTAARGEAGPAKANLLGVSETFLFHAANANDALAQWLLGRRYAGTDMPTSFPSDQAEAMRWLFAAGTNGVAPARLQMIDLLLESTTNLVGLRVEQTKQVMAWAKKLEKQGNVTASFFIGRQMLQDSQGPGEARNALKQIEKAASQGDARALHAVADMHLKGLAGKPNPPLALTNYLAAAGKGHLPSHVALGHWFYYGSRAEGGQKPDPARALQWFKQPAEAGDPEAEFCYAVLLLTRERASSTALTYLESAARKGHAQAQLYLAVQLEQKAKTPDEYARILDLYGAAAAAGLARAHFALGHIMQAGLVEGHGPERAAYHFRLAANDNYAPAQHALGLAYASGKGVPESSVESIRWFERAAENFSPDACEALALAYQHGGGVITNEVKAAEYRAKGLAFTQLRIASDPFRSSP